MNKQTVRDIAVENKIVLVRVDFNVPVDEHGKLISDEQIKLHFPTLEYLLQKKAKIVLITHFGNPGFEYDASYKLDHLQPYLQEQLKCPVHKTEHVFGEKVQQMIKEMNFGEILLLENIRFYEEEKNNDKGFAQSLADLGDIFVNDSFGTCHRHHASTIGIPKHIPAVAGLLLEKELLTLENLFKNPEKPLTLILGGKKTESKIEIIKKFLNNADSFLLGGGLANSFLYAQGFEVGMSLAEKDKLDDIQQVMLDIEAHHEKVILPEDAKVSDNINSPIPPLDLPLEDIQFNMKIFDIGNRTAKHFMEIIKESKTIIWSGPMGTFEYKNFQMGTSLIAKALATCGNTTIVGGGETLEALNHLNIPFDRFSHVSTGGGAMLDFLQGKKLPAVEVLLDK